MGFCIIAHSENIKLKANSVAVRVLNETTNKWGNWTDWNASNVVMVMDSEAETLTIYSSETQKYDLLKILSNAKDSEGNDVVQWQAINEDGLKCIVKFVVLSTGRPQLYVEFTNLCVAYNLIKP